MLANLHTRMRFSLAQDVFSSPAPLLWDMSLDARVAGAPQPGGTGIARSTAGSEPGPRAGEGDAIVSGSAAALRAIMSRPANIRTLHSQGDSDNNCSFWARHPRATAPVFRIRLRVQHGGPVRHQAQFRQGTRLSHVIGWARRALGAPTAVLLAGRREVAPTDRLWSRSLGAARKGRFLTRSFTASVPGVTDSSPARRARFAGPLADRAGCTEAASSSGHGPACLQPAVTIVSSDDEVVSVASSQSAQPIAGGAGPGSALPGVVVMPGDGNCQFHAIAHGLLCLGRSMSHSSLRVAACRMLAADSASYSHLLPCVAPAGTEWPARQG